MVLLLLSTLFFTCLDAPLSEDADHFKKLLIYFLKPDWKKGLPEKIRILMRIIFSTVPTNVDKKATLSLLGSAETLST